ncbi:hypothetical protein P4O66_005466, partial [Electrophorus voltai]
NLEYMRTARQLSPRQACWSLFFSRFNFKIMYRPGIWNTKADALSRVHLEEREETMEKETILPTQVHLASIQWEINVEIKQATQGAVTPMECPTGKCYAPASCQDCLLAHFSLAMDHPGETHTHQLIAHRYWWETMMSDVHRCISSCSVCGQSKMPKTLPASKLMPLPAPERPWSHIALDFVTDLPCSEGTTTILTVVDRFSRGSTHYRTEIRNSRIESGLHFWRNMADRHRGETPVYLPGDRVWLSMRDFRKPGSCRVQTGPQPVIAGLLDEASPGKTPPQPIDYNRSPVFAVHHILDSRRRGGSLQYLVDWEGFGPEEQSWVPRRDVLDPALISDFHARYLDRQAPHPWGRPRHIPTDGARTRPVSTVLTRGSHG